MKKTNEKFLGKQATKKRHDETSFLNKLTLGSRFSNNNKLQDYHSFDGSYCFVMVYQSPKKRKCCGKINQAKAILIRVGVNLDMAFVTQLRPWATFGYFSEKKIDYLLIVSFYM